MSSRLNEIKKRLESTTKVTPESQWSQEKWEAFYDEPIVVWDIKSGDQSIGSMLTKDDAVFVAFAPDDMRFLLGELQRASDFRAAWDSLAAYPNIELSNENGGECVAKVTHPLYPFSWGRLKVFRGEFVDTVRRAVEYAATLQTRVDESEMKP